MVSKSAGQIHSLKAEVFLDSLISFLNFFVSLVFWQQGQWMVWSEYNPPQRDAGVNFINILHEAFVCEDPKCKKDRQVSSVFIHFRDLWE